MIHELSNVQSKHIGYNTRIWQFSVILPNAVIGNNCNINCHTFIENDVEIGDHVTIKSGVYLWDGITIGNNVFIGPNVTFTNDKIPKSKVKPDSFDKLVIKNNASIGANATIVAPLTIAEFSMIGAGSVLTKSTKPFTLWYGNPAKQKGYVTKNGKVLNMDLKDNNGNEYIFFKNDIIKK